MIYINTVNELKLFAQRVNAGENALEARLESDIEFDGTVNNFTSIGTSANSYIGTFDGNNKKVSGLNMTLSSSENYGFFGYISTNASIKNLIIAYSEFTGTGGIIVGQANAGAKIENCQSYKNIFTATGQAGGICGYINNAIIYHCKNESDITNTAYYTGGICGQSYGENSEISECCNIGTITSNTRYIGGILGGETNSSNAIIHVDQCYNLGNVISEIVSPSATVGAGGICGYISHGTVSNCYNGGKITNKISAYGTGGIIGWTGGYWTCINCYNYGNMSDTYHTQYTSYVNAIVGLRGSSNYTIANCYYLDTCGQTDERAELKTEEELASGTFAINLGTSEIWKEDVNGINSHFPILSWQKVYKFLDFKNFILIYDSLETDFAHNGLHILCPTSCETTEELNGGYELTLTHPCDDEGRWKMLLEMNIIKAGGQLYRIYKKTKTMSTDGKKQITVNARHIWYDLADPLILKLAIVNLNGKQAIDSIINNMFVGGSGETFNYDFIGMSDITTVNSVTYENISPIKCFLGADNSLIKLWGGELERDNFTFSINTRRGKDNAFNISYGADMTEIEENIDYSNMITWLNASDNFGHTFAISYNDILIPHHKVESKQFQYDENDYDRFEADARAYFDSVYTPEINYKVSFANLKNLPEYADFVDLQRCELGDTGTIYNEPLEISTTQKIVKKTIDELTGDVLNIELGTVERSIVRPLKFSNVLPTDNLQNKMNAALKQQLAVLSATTFGTIDSLENYTVDQLELFTIDVLEGLA